MLKIRRRIRGGRGKKRHKERVVSRLFF